MVEDIASEAPQEILDPDQGDSPAPPCKRAKRGVVDEMPSLIPITVKTEAGETCEIRAVPTARDRANLTFELTEANLELLGKVPMSVGGGGGAVPFSPDLDGRPTLSWLSKRRALRTHYFSASSKKWCTKDG
eukprot:8647687-Pyramimonas_sp.AAC.1